MRTIEELIRQNQHNLEDRIPETHGEKARRFKQRERDRVERCQTEAAVLHQRCPDRPERDTKCEPCTAVNLSDFQVGSSSLFKTGQYGKTEVFSARNTLRIPLFLSSEISRKILFLLQKFLIEG